MVQKVNHFSSQFWTIFAPILNHFCDQFWAKSDIKSDRRNIQKRLIFFTPCHFFRVPISEADPHFLLIIYAFFDQKQAENRHISCCAPERVGYYVSVFRRFFGKFIINRPLVGGAQKKSVHNRWIFCWARAITERNFLYFMTHFRNTSRRYPKKISVQLLIFFDVHHNREYFSFRTRFRSTNAWLIIKPPKKAAT